MAPTSCSILLTFLLILVVPINSVSPIWDLKDPKVVSIAEFAVAEHNKKANKTLRFVSVFNGDYSVYSEKHNYQVYIDLSAIDKKVTNTKKYSASVLYRPLQKSDSMKLDDFSIFEDYKPGGMWPIEDLKDPGVVSVAKFAVKEYNKKANTPLQLVTVIKGKQLMVAGSIYYLLILAKDKTAPYPQKYEVAVSDRPWEIKGGFELESFKKLSKLNWIDSLNN
ncbi:hypothetical protein ABFS82_14G126600 [Erythranthe guttata]